MKTQLEHANLHVNDVDGMLRFLHAAFPDFIIRHDSGEDDPDRWLHIGHDDIYLAVNQATDPIRSGKIPYDGKAGINHLGFVVDDVDGLRNRLLESGFTETTYPNHHPARRRVYFNDVEGNDWEFVEYISDDPSERNDYTRD